MITWLKRKFNDWNYSCQKCGCTDYNERTVDQIEHIACEIEETCANCGTLLRLWAYGHYQYPNTRMECIVDWFRQKKLTWEHFVDGERGTIWWSFTKATDL